MFIHKEGHKFLLILLIVLVAVNAAALFLLPSVFSDYTIAISALVFIFFLQFFRNPPRKFTIGENLVIAPADGKVVVIEEVEEPEYFKDKRIQISIFMSPVNVHCNRAPVTGVMKYFKYYPGKYLVAWHPKSSTENERTSVVFENEKGVQILVRQIAGAVARRIVCYGKEGDKFKQGEDFGFIKLGSRVDIFLPLNAKIKVSLNQKPVGGETIIAELL